MASAHPSQAAAAAMGHSHHAHQPHKLSDRERKICQKIADTIRETEQEEKRFALAEEIYGFLRSRNLHNYKHLPCFPEVDHAWCSLMMETDTYRHVCQELFRFFLHRDKNWTPEPPPPDVKRDANGVPEYYRYISSSSFHTRPHWDDVLPQGIALEKTLPYIEAALTVGDAPRKTVLAKEVLGFLLLKAALHDVGQLYKISPPSAVDQGWHDLIKQSKLYEELSIRLQLTDDDDCDCDDEGDDEVDIIHHSMYQDGGKEGRKARLQNTLDTLLERLSSEKRKLVKLNVEDADWVGYDIPVAFRLLLPDGL